MASNLGTADKEQPTDEATVSAQHAGLGLRTGRLATAGEESNCAVGKSGGGQLGGTATPRAI